MAMLVVSGSTGIRPALCCVEGASLSMHIRARQFPLQRAKLQKNRWRISCAGVDYAGEWRRECGELRVDMHEIQSALADAWMQDEMNLLELEKLVSALVGVYGRTMVPDQVGNVEQASEGRDCELSVINSAIARNEDEASVSAKPELEGADELYKNAMILSELRSEELRAKQEGLSTLRRLKTLNVHEYVHSALQASHLRSWLQSRGIAE